MKNLAITLLLIYPVFLIAQTENKEVVLPEGTIVKAVLMQDLNGKKDNVGQTINFELSDNIIFGGRVVVSKGAKITGTITEAQRSKALGKKGKMSFSMDYLYLANGKVVKLRNNVEKNLRGSGGVVAATAILVAPLALFIKGKNAKYETGEVFDAYVDKDTEI
ncbi:MAG: hypothetical protein CVU08_14705 [Bacteroidetes bacterium HGW-Bacteroidetes-3]|jgi:hypothetical protein|nr:MAG: hypothetical protein CVU08_14705 [Bacteroidetes bacterium HGW-Bacteroidetes-3]